MTARPRRPSPSRAAGGALCLFATSGACGSLIGAESDYHSLAGAAGAAGAGAQAGTAGAPAPSTPAGAAGTGAPTGAAGEPGSAGAAGAPDSAGAGGCGGACAGGAGGTGGCGVRAAFSCAGFVSVECPDKDEAGAAYACKDDWRDECNPDAGGSDCPGLCFRDPLHTCGEGVGGCAPSEVCTGGVCLLAAPDECGAP